MRIYNTLTRQKEEFIPLHEGKVGIYACGPTVYNLMHIGNSRQICVFDTLRRYFEYAGYKVKFVQNFTDVDDKIIKQANLRGISSLEHSEEMITEYFTDAHGLNVRDADIHPKVTQSMDLILDIISTLIDKGYAYQAGGDVYFSTSKFEDYGKLSHMPLEDLQAGARIDVSEQKRDAVDFALWKAAKEGEPYWDSPWGKGRPGWHIECSAMSRHYIGDTIDIHGGGSDLIFPHHENEIAQSECATGHELARYWMHNGMISVDNSKMSKSKGNFFLVRDVAKQYGYEVIRFFVLQSHYRNPINYSTDSIEAAKAGLERIYNCRETLERALSDAPQGKLSDNIKQSTTSYKEQFAAAMEDDLNTADAFGVMFELVREINTALTGEYNHSDLECYAAQLDEIAGVLGLLYNLKVEEKIPESVMALVEKRKEARAAKDFATADSLRDQIAEMGYAIEETRQGTIVSKKA